MMRYSLTQSTPPASEPLTLTEAKTHLRVSGSTEDALITSLISAAREMAEAYTSRQFITATYTMKIEDFPVGEGPISLPRTPLGSVSSVTYLSTTGTSTTLSTDVYEVLSDNTRASIVLKPGQSWPNTRTEQREAVTITFTAGYGAATTDVPESARAAMLLIVGTLFDNRESVVIGTISSTLPLGVNALLDTVSARVPV